MYTAESVSPAHPDKICDRISDAILDAALEQDPDSRVAVETMGGHGIVTVTGELTSKAYIDIRSIVERIAPGMGVQVNIVQQSKEIATGVDTGGAGDQGIMVGYACRENDDYLPTEFVLARSLCQYIYDRAPMDGKTQVTVKDQVVRHILVSWQGVSNENLWDIVEDWINKEGIAVDVSIDRMSLITINPAGDWNVGGFDADTGLTGRKIVVDAYGPRVPVGGGAFSGKDATKVDRSAALMARYVAVQILNAKGNEEFQEVKVSLAYGIGLPHPLMKKVEWRYAGSAIWNWEYVRLEDHDFYPESIIKLLKLKNPQFEKLAEWGHFGHNNIWDN